MGNPSKLRIAQTPVMFYEIYVNKTQIGFFEIALCKGLFKEAYIQSLPWRIVP